MNKKKSGFSLIELSIVILVIGILIAGVGVGISLVGKANTAIDTYVENNVPEEDRRKKSGSSSSGKLNSPASGCSGGDVDSTSAPGEKIHKFTAVGSTTFTCTGGGDVKYLIVGGGGGGGAFNGGGGAGGLLTGVISVTAGVNYTVVVGAGGIGENSPNGGGTNGNPSSFNGLVAYGGGKGWHNVAGSPGGSGGGSGYGSTVKALGVVGQGYDGGAGFSASNGWAGGGGGGAGGAGGSGSFGRGGDAGSGFSSDITGIAKYYAVGGPGASYNSSGTPLTSGTAATGGSSAGQDALDNTGNGGPTGLTTWTGKKGGSGIVVIRY